MSAILFYSIYSFLWIFSKLPLKILYLFSDTFYLLNYYVFAYRKKVVYENLRNSFPGTSDEEVKRISKKYYRHLCDLFIENFKLIHISKKQMARHVSFEGVEILDDYYKKGKSIIGFSSHYGNWEWLGAIPLVSEHEVWAAYKPLKNKYFDRFINGLRKKYGVQIYSMKDTVRTILKNHQNGKITLNMLISDQIPAKRDIHYWTNFLNQDTACFLGGERIAKKTGFACIFMSVIKEKRGKYKIKFTRLVDDPEKTKKYEITEKYIMELQELIIRKPEYWLWSHRRWKHNRPESWKP
ncbi:lysophospholipid acyltransferase family protein [Bacteroidota bacterium]